MSTYTIPGIESLFWFSNLPGLMESYQEDLDTDLSTFGDACSDQLFFRSGTVMDVLGLTALGITLKLDFRDFMNLSTKDATAYWTEDRYHNEREGRWLQLIETPWLCSLLSGNEACLLRICNWMKPERNCEFAGKIDYAIVPLLNAMSRFVSEPFTTDQQLLIERQLAGATSKHTKSLISSYRAMINANETDFAREFTEGLKMFSNGIRNDIKKRKDPFIDRRPYKLFSCTHSIQWCIAKRVGFAMPTLSAELMSHLVVPETLGLDS